MSIFWWLLSLAWIVLLIWWAGWLAYVRLYGVGAADRLKWLRAGGEPMPMSSGQARCVAALQVPGYIGLVIIWSALVYVFIPLSGSHLARLGQDSLAAQALAFSLYYTSLLIALMRPEITGCPFPTPVRRIACHAFTMFLSLVIAIDVLIQRSWN